MKFISIFLKVFITDFKKLKETDLDSFQTIQSFRDELVVPMPESARILTNSSREFDDRKLL